MRLGRGRKHEGNKVHIIKNRDGLFNVWQEGTVLVPRLEWPRAIAIAKKLGGTIVIHGSEEAPPSDSSLPHFVSATF
jgi:hypothetical protein